MKQIKIKKLVIVFVLLISLLAVQTLEIAVKASGGNPDITNPSIIVSTLTDLQEAINNSTDGAVIGIDSIIVVDSPNITLGSEDGSKHIYIVPMNPDSYFWITQTVNLTLCNITLDGNGFTCRNFDSTHL